MSILMLANELLLLIAENLDCSSLYSFLITNRRLAILLQPSLLKFALRPEYAKISLYWAAANRDEALVRLFLEKGQFFQVVREEQEHQYLDSGSCGEEVVQYVLSKGPNLVLDNKMLYGLELQRDHTILLDDPDITDCFGPWSALQWAVRSNHEPMLKMLLEKEDIDLHYSWADAYRPEKPLHTAASRGNEKMVKMLLRKMTGLRRALRGICLWSANTALRLAVVREQEEVVRILIENGADVDSKHCYNFTLLHYAVVSNNLPITSLLIENGANVSSINHMGRTPLHTAVEHDFEDMARLLVEKGADVNVKHHGDRDMCTPLHRAVIAANKSVVALLLKSGAEVNTRSHGKYTPLHLAARIGSQDCVRMLLDAGAEVDPEAHDKNTPLHMAARRGQHDIVKILIEHGAGVNLKGWQKCTPFHSAVLWGHFTTSQLLLEKGADVNSKNRRGNTALHLAARYGEVDLVRLLVENGADVQLENRQERTPLLEAIWEATNKGRNVCKEIYTLLEVKKEVVLEKEEEEMGRMV